MTDHPITPPPELVQQWIGDYYGCPVSGELAGVETAIATRAAQWGADQELEAFIQWMIANGYWGKSSKTISALRTARRPKPPNLAEEALARVKQYKNDFMPPLEKDWEIICRALERLQQLEEQQ